MNVKQTWALVILALALSTYIAFFEREPAPKSQQRSESPLLLPDIEPSRVTTVEVARTNPIRAVRDDEAWLLAGQFPAQRTAIEDLLDKVARLRRQGYISPELVETETTGLNPFGLAPPQAILSLQQGSNQIQIIVGRKTPIGEQLYVRIPPDRGVILTEASLLQHLPNSINDWRDRALFDVARRSFNRLEVQTGNRGYELLQDATNSLWRFVKPMPARADTLRVENLIQTLQTARITDFVPDDTKADVEAFGLHSPEAAVIVSNGTNQLFHLQLGRPLTNAPAQVYARRLSQTNIIVVSKDLLDFLRLPHSSLRDRSLITFSPGAVDLIEVKTDTPFSVQRQTNDAWIIVAPAVVPADARLVQSLLTNLLQLEVVEYVKDVVTDFGPFGLAAPEREYTLRGPAMSAAGPTNSLLAQVAFSTNLNDRVHAQRADEASVYAVPFAEVLRLPAQAVELRTRRIWEFSPSDVKTITVVRRGQTRQLARDPSSAWGLGDVQNAAVEEILFRLGQLQALAWVAQGPDKPPLYGIKEGEFQLTLQLQQGNTPPRTLTVYLGNLSPQKNAYAAVQLPDQPGPTVFQFSGALYAELVRSLSPAAPAP